MGQQKLKEMHPLIYQERKAVIEQLAMNLMERSRLDDNWQWQTNKKPPTGNRSFLPEIHPKKQKSLQHLEYFYFGVGG